MQSGGMKRRDIILLAGIAAVIAGCFLGRSILYREGAVYAEIAQDGRVIETVSLSGDTPRDIRIETDGGYNIVHVGNGAVYVTDADCAGHDCIKQGVIRHAGQSIICLPHRLTITVKRTDGSKDEENEYDAVVQ